MANYDDLDDFDDFNYDWEDDMDITDSTESDPFNDEAVMDFGEDMGTDDCPFG